MATLRTVQRNIYHLEGFQVRFRHRRDGRDVRDDRKGIPKYPYERMAKNSWSVAGWKRSRFTRNYPEFQVEVLIADGSVPGGRTRLATVRDTYLD